MLSRNFLRFAPSNITKRSKRGVDFLRNRFTNKGTAFTEEERKHMRVEGLLPPAIETLDDQVLRYWGQIQRLEVPINRYQLLRGVLDSNVTLFYAIVTRYLKQTLPIIYTPTVGEACERYGSLYQRDHCLYISLKNKGNIAKLIKNCRKPFVDVLVITDGSRILGLGDLGANGVGISIGKCSLYVAAGGIKPSRVLPVLLDVGTNNKKLLDDPLYLGQSHPRAKDDEFYSLLDEFMEASKEAWPNAVIQFEDFSNNHCFDMLTRYQKKYRCFNDDIQGTGAVIAAGFANAIKQSGIPIEDHRLLFFGAGSAATGVAESIINLAAYQFKKDPNEVRKQFYFYDSKGLVTTTRGDKLAPHKIPFACTTVPAEDNANLTTFEEVVKYVKPTALIGLGATSGVFSESIVKHMCTYCKRPIIFPLSNPSSKAEIIPSDGYKWSNGQAIIASGSPFASIEINGKLLSPSQGNNLYVFPGVGLGSVIAQSPYIPNEALVAAAVRLSQLVPSSDLNNGALYPPISDVRDVSVHVAVAVIKELQKMKIAKKDLPTDETQLIKLVRDYMWNPVYPDSSYYMGIQIEE